MIGASAGRQNASCGRERGSHSAAVARYKRRRCQRAPDLDAVLARLRSPDPQARSGHCIASARALSGSDWMSVSAARCSGCRKTRPARPRRGAAHRARRLRDRHDRGRAGPGRWAGLALPDNGWVRKKRSARPPASGCPCDQRLHDSARCRNEAVLAWRSYRVCSVQRACGERSEGPRQLGVNHARSGRRGTGMG